MDTNQQPKAAYLAQELKAGKWSPNILQNEVALRQCAAEELLRQHAENETLRTGYNAARLEIESLQARIQELSQMARDCNSRRVMELQAELVKESARTAAEKLRADQMAEQHRMQCEMSKADRAKVQELEAMLAAVGAGGMEPLRKRECLHSISEPQSQAAADNAGEYPELPEPALKESKGICCGNFTTGAQYMGQSETLCCENPDEAWPESFTADQMRAYVDADRAARGAAQAVPADAPHTELEDAARALVEAIEYTPLGLRSIKALEKVRAALSSSAQAAPVDAAVPTKVIEALEMLESGALNVAMNAKNRGDGYDEGYANAMAKMARKTLDALAATTAADAQTTAEKSEMLELILALQAFIGFAESNGEIVFAGGGMQAIEEINSCTKAARAAIAKVEGTK